MSWTFLAREGTRIPTGRQLPRTPPLDVKKHLDFCDEDPHVDQEEPQKSVEAGDEDQMRMMGFMTPVTKTENISEPLYPDSMLKGMKGYQLTPGDLEFIKKMKEEKCIKKLQGDLEEVQRSLKKEKMALELAYASRDKAREELNKFPSREELSQWLAVVLAATSPSTESTDLDAKSLLAVVTEENVRTTLDEKWIEVSRMGKMVESKRKKEAKEKGLLEKRIAAEQLKIQGMMNQLSELTSELAQQEEVYRALQMQIKTSQEIKVEAEIEDASEKLKVKHPRKERKNKKEKLQDTTNQSKSTKSRRADGKAGNPANGKDDLANESAKTSTTEQTKRKTEEKTAKVAKGPQRKVKAQESKPLEPVKAVRGRGRASGPAAPRDKNQTTAKPGESRAGSQQAAPRGRGKAAAAPQDAAEEALGLRRSKRIASRS